MIMMMIEDYHHEKSGLESLPQVVLLRIICSVDHEDLNQLHNVSKSIREATVIAKKLHFAFSTPTKVKAFGTSIDFKEPSELNTNEAPNAPRQWRCMKRREMRIEEDGEDESESRRSIRKRLLHLLETEKS